MSEYKRLTLHNLTSAYDYAESNLSQEEIAKIYDRLAELEDKIDKGLLIEIGYCKDCRHCEKYDSGLYCPYGDCGTEPNDKCCLFSKPKPKPKQGSKN